jgi:putative acetyltransferase
MDCTLEIRPEKPEDLPAIDEVNAAAFGRPDEAKIVAALRETAGFDPSLSLVAMAGGKAVGHLLLTPVPIVGEAEFGGVVALAPMAVLPARQKRGIGSGLVRAGLEAARARGHRAVVVLGHPAYYPRFGFVPASRFGIRAPFEAPDEAFLARELVPGGLAGVAGTVRYPPPLLTP